MHWAPALVALPPRAPRLRLEVLGLRRRRGAARSGARGVLGTAGVRRRPGLRPDRNRADRHAESSAARDQGRGRQADRRRRDEDRRRTARSWCAATTSPAATSTRPRRPRAAFQDGWFHTGDIGELDARGPAAHPRPQEGDDRHAGRAERLSGGRRAGAERAARRARVGGRRRRGAGATPSACTRCWSLEPGADVDAIVRAANASSAITRRSAPRSVWPERGAAAHRRHAQAEAARAARLAGRAADVRAARRVGRDARSVASVLAALLAGRGDHRRRRRSTSSA